MTVIVPDPDSHRNDYPVVQYRADPLTAPQESEVTEALQAVATRCAEAASERTGGLCPEIDLLVISPSEQTAESTLRAATEELYVRCYEHSLLDDISVMRDALPDRLQQADTSPVTSIAEIVSHHSDSSDQTVFDRSSEYLVDHEGLATDLANSADRMLTVRPAQSAHHHAETDLSRPPSARRERTDPESSGYSMAPIEHLHEADWELHPNGDGLSSNLGRTYTTDRRPDFGMVRQLVESLADFDGAFICQIHLEFAYEIDGHPVTPSRAADVTGTFDADAQIEPATELGFGFRLFAFADSQDADLDKHLQELGKQVARRHPEQYSPAIYTSGEAVRHHTKRLFLGQALKQSEPHNDIYRRPIEAMGDWLALPAERDWYAAGRFLPIPQQFLAQPSTGSNDEATGPEYSLGRDPVLDQRVVTPGKDPQSHIIYSNDRDRRETLLSRYIDVSRVSRQGPVLVLDWTGSLRAAYFSRAAESNREEILERHALIDVATMPLATTPLQFANPTTVTEIATTDYEIDDVRDLYTTLLQSSLDDLGQLPTEHLDDVLTAFGKMPGVTVSHPDLVAELEHHCPQQPHHSGSESAPQAPRARATKAAFDDIHETLPASLLGNLCDTVPFAEPDSNTDVVWLTLEQIDTTDGKRLTGALLLDALSRKLSRSGSRPPITVVCDQIQQIPVTEATTDRLSPPPTSSSNQPGLALVAGKHLDDTTPPIRSPLENGAVATVDTRAANDASSPPAAPGANEEVQRQHATDHSLVVLPSEMRPDTSRPTTIAPVDIPTTDSPVSDLSAQHVDQLRAHSHALTPAATEASFVQPSDRRPFAIHTSKRADIFTTHSPADTEQAERDADQQSLEDYHTKTFPDRPACSTCGTQYATVTDAMLCHAAHAAESTQTPPDTDGVAYPQHFVDQLTWDDNDAFTAFIKDLLTDPTTTLDLPDARHRLQEGLADRIDGDEYGEIPLPTLAFFQAIELERVGQFADDITVSDLKRAFLSDTTTTFDEVRDQYVTVAQDATNQSYLELTDLAQSLPITTLSTSSSAPSLAGLDDPYPLLKARRKLAEQFHTTDEITQIEFIHHPNPDELADTFPVQAIDVAGFNRDGQLTKAGITITRATLDERLSDELIAWAADIPAEVTLILEKEATSTRRTEPTVAQSVVSHAATTEHLNFTSDRRKPLTKTQYRLTKIKDLISWQPGTNISLQSDASLQ